MPWEDELVRDLAELERRGLRRSRRTLAGPTGRTVWLDGRELIQFCSNDYLNLATDPQVAAAASAGAARWGVGSGGSALVAGHLACHAELETQLADWMNKPAALVTSSGYAANHAVLTALADERDLICVDKLVHASLIDAARTSGATVRIFAHHDVNKLRRLLSRQGSATGENVRRRLIVTDSIFSMDGDAADLRTLVAIKNEYDAILVVDEAHGLGLFGSRGGGCCEAQGVATDVDVITANLAKSVGTCGGFVAGSEAVIHTLINQARSYIYSTALSPMVACAASAAVRLIQAEPQRRERVHALADRLRCGLGRLSTAECRRPCPSVSPIVPFMVGDNHAALGLSNHLMDAGFLVPAIRPPTVAPGSARLRISVTAGHSQKDVDSLIQAIQAAAGVG